MNKLGWLIVVAALATGCKKEPDAASTGSASASGSAVASGSAPGSDTTEPAGSAGSGSGSGYTMTKDDPEPPRPDKTGFAAHDDRVAGKTPWLSDDEAKAGIVELIADDDLTGKTKGTFTTKRLCGDAAKKAAAKHGEFAAKRAADADVDQTECRVAGADPNRTLCLTGANGEGDFSGLFEYRKVKDVWTLVGVRVIGVGIDVEKQDAEYEKLLGTTCK